MSMPLPPGLFSVPDTASPLPTPPASTSGMQLCFPSPTSVADILSHHPPASSPPPSDDDITLKIATPPHPTSPSSPPTATIQQSPPIPPNPSPDSNPIPQPPSLTQIHYHYPQLANPSPSPPLTSVTKPQFTTVLNQFIASQPPISNLPLPTLAAKIRNLLDHLDALSEQLTLRLTNSLFDALSHPNCLTVLIFLLSDISAASASVANDVRKSYRYPYLVANILANGPMSFRNPFIASSTHVHHLLSFLDLNLPLSTTQPPHHNHQAPCTYARDNPTIVGNVVQVLVSNMETNPDALFAEIRHRSTFLPALVNLLHIGSVPTLFNSMIIDRCVDDVTAMDPGHVSFDAPMATALHVLAAAGIFHLLSHAFVNATQTIYELQSEGNDVGRRKEVYQAEQMSYNVVRVFALIVKKTVRAMRLECEKEELRKLRVFSDHDTALTLMQVVRVGIQLFHGTDRRHVGQLHTALGGAIETLKYVQQDREKRAPNMMRQPEPLDVRGFESNVGSLLRELMEVLMDVVLAERFGETRLKIMEFFVQVQMICSDEIVRCLDAVRWGEVALKMTVMHARNSLLHQIVLQGVEWSLLSDRGGGKFALHWLKKTRLAEQVMRIWRDSGGAQLWDRPGDIAEKPYLSAVLHMACCVEHWIAMKADAGEEVEDAIRKDTLEEFRAFWQDVEQKVMSDERKLLGGPKPSRKQGRGTGLSVGGFFGGLKSTRKTILRGGGGGFALGGRAHLVRSKSGHRFGWSEPASGSRSRLDDVFAERGDGDSSPFGRLGRGGRSATSFASVFDVEGDSTL